MDDDLKALFRRRRPPEPDQERRAATLAAARRAFARENQEQSQGSPEAMRQTVRSAERAGLIERIIGRFSMTADRLNLKPLLLGGSSAVALLAAIWVYQNEELNPSPFEAPDFAMSDSDPATTDLSETPMISGGRPETETRATPGNEADPVAPMDAEPVMRADKAAPAEPAPPPAPQGLAKAENSAGVDFSLGQGIRVRRGTSVLNPEQLSQKRGALEDELQRLEAEESLAAGAPATDQLAPVARTEGFVGAVAGDGSGIIAPEPPIVIDPLPPQHWQQQGRDRFASAEPSPFRSVTESPVSTFSIDVDTASYSFARRALMQGRLPDPASVRVEEMINYFDYAYAPPVDREVPFATDVEIMDTPWDPVTKLMRIGIKGYEVPASERPATNIVLLIDVSGSMNSADKLPLLLSSFRLLVNQLDERDSVSIVTYAGNAGVALLPTNGADKAAIERALNHLRAGGSTAGAAGINTAYDLAEQAFIEGGVNRVILATDGDFNVGVSDPEALKRMVERKRRSGVMLSVLGFGQGNLNDNLMQTLAQNGNGQAAYIDTLAEAQKVLVEEAGSTLFTIAKDVKIQIEFNPATVSEYRLIGYETRALKREDFNNDRIDAGEIGSGHTVTALYEFTPAGAARPRYDGLRYQVSEAEPEAAAADASGSGELAFLKIRYKQPDGDVSQLIERAVMPNDAGASDDTRFAAAVAGFGQLLRGAPDLGGYGFEDVADLARDARGSDPYGHRGEFLRLVELARVARP